MSDMERDARRREVRAAGGTRLTVADLINVGVFGAVYFALVGVAALASMAVFGVAGNILLPAIAAVLAGPVFMLMVARVRRFGAITLMGLMLGLFLFVSGHFATSLVTAIVFPLAADCIARFGAWRRTWELMLSYVVFSFGCTGPILPLWMMKDAYIASLERKGKDAAYIDALFGAVNGTTFVVAMVAIVIGALVGGLFGMRLMRRHFLKAAVA